MNRQTSRSISNSLAKMRGVTLMELMIVVAIVGILAAIGYPSYEEYGRRANRAEGRAYLLDSGARLERYYSDNNQYAALATVGIPTTSENGRYSLGIALGANNQSFDLTAQPLGWTDPRCGNLTYDNQGDQDSSIAADDCWSR